MSNAIGEAIKKEILEAIHSASLETVKKLEGIIDRRFEEVLETVNVFADQTERRFERLESGAVSLKEDVSCIKSGLSGMVTKDYLDEKMLEQRADLVLLTRKEDRKLGFLVRRLKERNIISEQDVQDIFSLEPFPQTV